MGLIVIENMEFYASTDITGGTNSRVNPRCSKIGSVSVVMEK